MRTSPSLALGLDLQAALVDEVEGLDGVAPVDDARDVDLVRALADEIDVDSRSSQRIEYIRRDTDHIPHLVADNRND